MYTGARYRVMLNTFTDGLSACPMSTKRKMSRQSKRPERSLEIVHGSLSQAWFASLPREIRDAVPDVHAKIQDDPRAAIAQLRTWIEREPVPMFFNWLGTAYGALGEIQAMEATIRENYERNPQYLFARFNYAELCLDSDDPEAAREAIGGTLDIRALLGGRKRVHVSELAGFFYIVARYHLQTGDRAGAEKVFAILEDAAPDEPGTEELRRLMYPFSGGLFRRG